MTTPWIFAAFAMFGYAGATSFTLRGSRMTPPTRTTCGGGGATSSIPPTTPPTTPPGTPPSTPPGTPPSIPRSSEASAGRSCGTSTGAVNAVEASFGTTRGAVAARAAAGGGGGGGGATYDGDAKKAFLTRSFPSGSGSRARIGATTTAAAKKACSKAVSGQTQPRPGVPSPTCVAKRGGGATVVAMLGSLRPLGRSPWTGSVSAMHQIDSC